MQAGHDVFLSLFFSLSRFEQTDSLLDAWIHSPPAVCANHRVIVTHVNFSCWLYLKGLRAVVAKFT